MTDLREAPGRRGWRARVAAWTTAAAVYGGAQALSGWTSARIRGVGARPQYQQFRQPAFAPPGVAFPVVWTALNLTTATSAWRLWSAAGGSTEQDQAAQDTADGPGQAPATTAPGEPDDTEPRAAARSEALAWWAAAVVVRSGYMPLAFGGRRLWAATADSALLCAVMVRYALVARRVDREAAILAIPEIAWTAFATVLSTAVARQNPLTRQAPPAAQPGPAC